MSTYLYLQCLEHDPPISSDGEVGQHLYDLDDVKKLYVNRELLIQMQKQDLPITWDSNFQSNASRFFCQHPNCTVQVVTEYGDVYPL